MLQTYNVETLNRIDVVFADGKTESLYLKDAESVEDMQERVKNLYSENFDDDVLESVIGYDYNGDYATALTPTEFFGPLGGF